MTTTWGSPTKRVTMNQRDQFILFCRELITPPMSRSQIAELLGLSNERVRQIENQIHRNLNLAWAAWAGDLKRPELPRQLQGRRYPREEA